MTKSKSEATDRASELNTSKQTKRTNLMPLKSIRSIRLPHRSVFDLIDSKLARGPDYF